MIKGKIYTHLYPNKINVKAKNLIELEKIKSKEIRIRSNLIPKKKNQKYYFPEKTNILEELVLKKDCFVMLNTNLNLSKKLVNGTQGIFKGFENNKAIIITNDGERHLIDKFSWDFKDFYIEQYPLCLAWAITIHKSQGMGIEFLSIDIGRNIFEDGQAYVALSRTKNLNGLHIKNFDLNSISVVKGKTKNQENGYKFKIMV